MATKEDVKKIKKLKKLKRAKENKKLKEPKSSWFKGVGRFLIFLAIAVVVIFAIVMAVG